MAQYGSTVEDLRLKERHRLDWWVDPELAWEVRDDSSDRKDQWKQVNVEGPPKDQLIVALRDLHHSSSDPNTPKQSLLLLNGAGAGKSCVSLRIEHLLCNKISRKKIFDTDQPLLVIHWASALPKQIDTNLGLKEAIAADPMVMPCKDSASNQALQQENRKEAIDYALRRGRVAIIIDAFDEFAQRSKDILIDFYDNTNPKPLWIFTSRDYAVRDHQEFFSETFFRRLRIKPFSKTLQNQFMGLALDQKVVQAKWRETLDPSQSGWDELLGLPHTLRALADILNKQREFFDSNGKVQEDLRFQSPSDLFLRTTRHLLEVELNKDSTVALKADHGIKIENGFLIPELERAMGAIALEMATRGYWTQVQGGIDQVIAEVNKIREAARQRFLESRAQDFCPVKESEGLWDFSYEFLKKYEFSGGGLQLEAGNSFLQFPTRKIQEMRIARYVTRYAAREDGEAIFLDDSDAEYAEAVKAEQISDHRRGASQHHSSGAWEEVWRNVIGMPLAKGSRPGLDAKRYKQVLRWLYQPSHAGERRPTQLMTEAWVQARKLGKQDTTWQPFAYDLVSGLQKQFQQILAGGHGEDKKTIAESLIAPGTYQILGEESGSGLDGDTGTFLMGDKKADKKDVTLTRFAMQKLLISNAQFQLFDDPYALKSQEALDRFGSDDQPAVFVSWYDAWWFSRFVGEVEVTNQAYRVTLPTEAQWEYSARAGSDGDFFRAKGINANGEEIIIEVTEEDLSAYAHFDQNFYTGGTLPVTSKDPSLWGLRMAGNAWQWTLNSWRESLPGGRDPLVTGGMGSNRVSRGGCWDDPAALCRAAYRDRVGPTVRTNVSGFRLALSLPSGVSSPAEQGEEKGAKTAGGGTEGAKAEPRPEMP
ncbi:MAG: hypothetical protein CBB60_000755 [Armatimonadetes bacterium Cent15-Ar3]|nr:MAG: hypothetical protein CBB60_000755 [Armatimonadetes bacterium Cent15-Ar3]